MAAIIYENSKATKDCHLLFNRRTFTIESQTKKVDVGLQKHFSMTLVGMVTTPHPHQCVCQGMLEYATVTMTGISTE